MTAEPSAIRTASAEVGSGRFVVEFRVPEDLISLAVELDDEAAAAAHAAFVDARLAPTAPGKVRRRMLAQLAEALRMLRAARIGHLDVASVELDGRWVMCLVGVSVVPFTPPPEVHPGSALAAILGHQDPDGQAIVEGFETPHGPAAGVRHPAVLTVPAPDPGRQPRRADAGAAQAMVAFPQLGLLGVVSGLCLDLHDIDLTAAVVAAIARTLNITTASDGLSSAPSANGAAPAAP